MVCPMKQASKLQKSDPVDKFVVLSMSPNIEISYLYYSSFFIIFLKKSNFFCVDPLTKFYF